MGCASTVNQKEPDQNKIIRVDVSTLRSINTPKNEINLMRTTEELLNVFKHVCGENNE